MFVKQLTSIVENTAVHWKVHLLYSLKITTVMILDIYWPWPCIVNCKVTVSLNKLNCILDRLHYLILKVMKLNLEAVTCSLKSIKSACRFLSLWWKSDTRECAVTIQQRISINFSIVYRVMMLNGISYKLVIKFELQVNRTQKCQ